MKNKYFLIVIVIIPFIISVRNSLSQTSQDEEYNQKLNSINQFVNDFHGNSTLRYRGRKAEGDQGSDHDFYESLNLHYRDPLQDKISGYFHGVLRQDFDDPGSAFLSIDDTYDKSLRGYLYELYGSIKDVTVLEEVKIGRQYLYDVETLHFDGIHLSYKPVEKVQLTSYGGLPVYSYESDPDGDWIGGVSSEVKPLDGSTLRFDYISTSDNNSDFDSHHDNLYVFSAWQDIVSWWHVYGRYSAIDSISRDWQIRSMWNFFPINLDIQFSYYKQPQALDNFTTGFNEFVPLMAVYQPYDQYTLDIYKGIGQYMGVNFGTTIRELESESDESSFNHDYERYYITYSIFDLPLKGLTLSFTGEDYETAGDDVQSLNFDVTHSFSKRLKISLGSYYSLYKFDTTAAQELIKTDDLSINQFILPESLIESERDNVRNFYLKVKKKIFDRWEINGKYELENYDSEIFHTVETALKLQF